MFKFKDKKTKICFWGLYVSAVIFLVVFFATDGLLGDKGFSEYTHEDWAIAMLPLSIIILSGISTLIFSLLVLIPAIRIHTGLKDYLLNKKFGDLDPNTEFVVFDHSELKRACCYRVNEYEVWFSVKEYSFDTRTWTTLEEGRCIAYHTLVSVLQEEYGYDDVKVFQ